MTTHQVTEIAETMTAITIIADDTHRKGDGHLEVDHVVEVGAEIGIGLRLIEVEEESVVIVKDIVIEQMIFPPVAILETLVVIGTATIIRIDREKDPIVVI